MQHSYGPPKKTNPQQISADDRLSVIKTVSTGSAAAEQLWVVIKHVGEGGKARQSPPRSGSKTTLDADRYLVAPVISHEKPNVISHEHCIGFNADTIEGREIKLAEDPSSGSKAYLVSVQKPSEEFAAMADLRRLQILSIGEIFTETLATEWTPYARRQERTEPLTGNQALEIARISEADSTKMRGAFNARQVSYNEEIGLDEEDEQHNHTTKDFFAAAELTAPVDIRQTVTDKLTAEERERKARSADEPVRDKTTDPEAIAAAERHFNSPKP